MTTKPKPDTPLAPTRFIHPGADITDGATGKPYGQAGEKSAGQLAYEKHCEDEAFDSYGKQVLPPSWAQLPPSSQKKWQWNATATPKAQTIKAP